MTDFSAGFGVAPSLASTQAAAARHWRLLALAAPYSTGGYFGLWRFSLFAAADGGGTDLAIAGAAAASSVFSGSYPASYVNDNNDGTRWSSLGGQSAGAWIAIDLGTPQVVRALTIHGFSSGTGAEVPSAAMLQRSDDGVAWFDVASVAPADAGTAQTFANLQ